MSTYLEELAVRFVERDGLSTEEHEKIAANAADFVLHPEKHSSPAEPTVLILVKSIHRWVFSGDDDDPSDFAEKNREKHARGLKFLAMTLNALPKDFLQSTQIKMLASFFCSIYQQQDPAGLAAATEALLVLLSMANFPPSSADDIITNVAKMEPENFSKQLAKTRLQIFQVIKTLLLNPKSARVLQKRYEGSEFLLPVFVLAKRERDPVNLLNWFRMLETVLKRNKISPDVATAAFETFSPFFPISIRRSTAMGPEVTEDELKEALRSCFAANGLLAQHTFPFLLEKLNDGGNLTASAKLDILRTIKACIISYESVDACLVPHVTKIWSSLKYEVRNGEVPEAVKETLSIFECLPQRLAGQSSTPDAALMDFLSQTWKDSAEDLENPTYTEQAGSILISVAGGGVLPFCHICPRLLEATRRNIAQPKSEAHTKYLLILLNNLLRTRLNLVSKLEAASSSEAQVFPGTEFDIPVTIVHDIYFKLFRENTVERPTKDQTEIAKEALKGLALVVQQQRVTEGWKTVDAYDQDTFKEICTALAYRATNCFNVPPTTTQELQDIDKSTVEALKTTVKFFPEGYGKILAGVLSEVKKRDWEKSPAQRSFNDLHALCQRVAFIGCTDVPVCSTPIVNFAAFTGTMLHMLTYLHDERTNLKACAIVADALATGMAYFSRTCAEKGLKKSSDTVATWDIPNVRHEVQNGLQGFPQLARGFVDNFDPVQLVQSAKPIDHDVFTSFILLGVYAVSELYQHAVVTGSGSDSDLNWSLRIRGRPGLELDDQETDRHIQAYLEEVGLIATTVLRELSPSAQKDLNLDAQMIWYFQELGSDSLLEEQKISRLDKEIFALTGGIARGIRAEIVSKMSDVKLRALLVDGFNSPKGSGQNASTPRPRIQAVQDHVAFLLANKYDTRARAAPEDVNNVANHDAWIGVLGQIEKALNNETSADLDDFSRFTAILAGAFARRDKYIKSGLTTAVCHAAAKGSPETSPQIARILSQLFVTSKALDPANHTIQKPLYLQWTYHQCVHPILELAYPISQQQQQQQTTPGSSRDSTIYAIYALHAVKHLSFEHYAPDAASIVRIVLAAMQKAADNYDVEAACAVTMQVLQREPALFRTHVSSVVAAAKRVYEKAVLDPSSVSTTADRPAAEGDWPASPVGEGDRRFRYVGDRERIRKMSFRILQLLPMQFEESLVRPHADEVRVHLSWALGDRVREVRRVAEVAAGAWAKVST